MKVIDVESLPSNAANPNYFSGDVTLRPMPMEGADPVKLIRVEFGPAARTHWHNVNLETEWLEPVSEEQYGR
jgi:quercetin dioxygenase-like cupin family protein